MDRQPQPVPPMRFPERWLVVLRIAVGLWFAKSIFTKLTITLAWGFLPVPTASDRWIHVMPTLVGKYAEGNPVGFFREFLQNTVVTHAHLFAQPLALLLGGEFGDRWAYCALGVHSGLVAGVCVKDGLL